MFLTISVEANLFGTDVQYEKTFCPMRIIWGNELIYCRYTTVVFFRICDTYVRVVLAAFL